MYRVYPGKISGSFVNQLESFQKFGIKPGLKRINYLLEKLDNPHLKFKSIHVAGTNGKGSVCAMLASILNEAGYKTGLFTSPHLIKYNERININGCDIGDDYLFRIFKIVKPHAKKISATIFEILTAIAFKYFADQKVDIAVVEVGMGGRFDSTNVLIPEVSIITNVDLDHTEYLGKTLSKIAFEKAGIVKPKVPLITAEKKREALQVIKRICRDKNARLVLCGGVGRIGLRLALCGKHQLLNAALAVKVIGLLKNFKVTKKAIKTGLRKVEWPARFQIIKKKPLIILDGAHNPAGVRALKVTKIPRPLVLIVGFQKYKDVDAMIRELSPLAETIIVTQSSHPQALPVYELEKRFRKYFTKGDNAHCRLLSASNISLAIKKAQAIKIKKSILICGSLYLAGDFLKGLTPAG